MLDVWKDTVQSFGKASQFHANHQNEMRKASKEAARQSKDAQMKKREEQKRKVEAQKKSITYLSATPEERQKMMAEDENPMEASGELRK